LPRKLAEHVVGPGHRRLEPVERAPVEPGRRLAARPRLPRHASRVTNVVPVALVLAQVPEPLLAVEEQVLVPAVSLAIDDDAAALEADDVEDVTMKLAARAQRDLR